LRLHPRLPRTATSAIARPHWVRRLVPLLLGSVLVTLVMCCAVSHGEAGDAHHHTPIASVAGPAHVVVGSDAPDEHHSASECAPGAIPRPVQSVMQQPVFEMAAVTLGVAAVYTSVLLSVVPRLWTRSLLRTGRTVLATNCRWRI
jgi:hypothetical protein